MRTGNYMTQERVLALIAAANDIRDLLHEIRLKTRAIERAFGAGDLSLESALGAIQTTIQSIDPREITTAETIRAETTIFNQSRQQRNLKRRDYRRAIRESETETTLDETPPDDDSLSTELETAEINLATHVAAFHRELYDRTSDATTKEIFELAQHLKYGNYQTQLRLFKALETSGRIVLNQRSGKYDINSPETGEFNDDETATTTQGLTFGRKAHRAELPGGENKAGTGSTTPD